jgi:hypothetical protein
MSNRWRVVIAVGFVAVAVGLFVVLRQSGDEDASADTATFALSVPAGGSTSIEQLDAKQGQRVVLTVELADAGEIHVHGYDLTGETGPGEPPASFDFVADIPGIFEIEVEDTGKQFAELRVTP